MSKIHRTDFRKWRRGLPPKSGYHEARRRYRNAGGQWESASLSWSDRCWWNGQAYVERNQFTGGERMIFLDPVHGQRSEWRECKAHTLNGIVGTGGQDGKL
jgi:hypothetical protein